MIAQRMVTDGATQGNTASVQEAITLLSHYRSTKMSVQRWVCEVCGLVHTGTVPDSCDGCGAAALTQDGSLRREIGSRW